jgi:hypothetical protein
LWEGLQKKKKLVFFGNPVALLFPKKRSWSQNLVFEPNFGKGNKIWLKKPNFGTNFFADFIKNFFFEAEVVVLNFDK